jgi:hypothetical protein
VVVLEVANKTLWYPYLARVQQSIFAQYVIMILTDFAVDGTRSDTDQRVALDFAATESSWDKMSLYAISKAVRTLHTLVKLQSSGTPSKHLCCFRVVVRTKRLRVLLQSCCSYKKAACAAVSQCLSKRKVCSVSLWQQE